VDGGGWPRGYAGRCARAVCALAGAPAPCYCAKTPTERAPPDRGVRRLPCWRGPRPRLLAISEVFVIVRVPKEIKVHEYRVGAVPAFVQALTSRGHEVVVEKGAGLGSAIPDEAYVAAGARLVDTADEVWRAAEMIVKVKEPIEEEY